jgi:hypothetical protein
MMTTLVCIDATAQPSPAPILQAVDLSQPRLPAARVIALFRALCMGAFPDRDAIGRRVMAAGLGFSQWHSGLVDRHGWQSRYGDLVYDGRNSDLWGRSVASCMLRFSIPEGLSSAAFVSMISTRIAGGWRPGRRGGSLTWRLRGRPSDRLVYMRIDPDRRFTLARRHAFPNRD